VRVDVALTPALAPADLAGLHVVVIDVLRATSTIVTALAAGADGVRPEAELLTAAAVARASGALLGGERGGLAPPGFDLGNSPAHYDRAACAGREVVLCTTNGTRAVASVRGALRVLSGSLLNAEATAAALAEAGAERVLLVCAGSRGCVSVEDTAAAGCIAGSLALQAGAAFGDGGRLAVALFDAWRHDLPGLLRRGEAGGRLAAVGLSADVEHCARVDSVPRAVALDRDGVFRELPGADAGSAP
jgi:2-phosphosulfolactate phosphatase